MPLTSVEKKTPMDELLEIIARLRDPVTGSPWEQQQTSLSICPNMLEEAYEAVDAITRNDLNELKGELGDVLLQVVFHSQFAREQGAFTFDEVVQTLIDKIKARLPAFFAHTQEDLATQLDTWEEIKKKERASKGYTSLFDGIPLNLPALVRANKLQDRAKQMGFDWADIAPFFAKINEEIAEVKHALHINDHESLEDELGDLLSIVSQLTNKLGFDSETVLRQGNKKFEQRLRYVEQRMAENNQPHKHTPLEVIKGYWREAKAIK